MTKEEFFKDVDIDDVIEHFGVDVILENISSIDIANYCDSSVLGCIADEDLLSAVSYPEYVLDVLDDSTIIDYLEGKNYTVTNNELLTPPLKKLKEICRELQPKGYIGKEEAKKLICEYLNNWMTKSF